MDTLIYSINVNWALTRYQRLHVVLETWKWIKHTLIILEKARVFWQQISIFIGLPLCLSWWRIRLQCGRPGFNPWVGNIPWRRERLPTPIFWPGEFHGLYNPWGRKESDTTEWLSLLQTSILKGVHIVSDKCLNSKK